MSGAASVPNVRSDPHRNVRRFIVASAGKAVKIVAGLAGCRTGGAVLECGPNPQGSDALRGSSSPVSPSHVWGIATIGGGVAGVKSQAGQSDAAGHWRPKPGA